MFFLLWFLAAPVYSQELGEVAALFSSADVKESSNENARTLVRLPKGALVTHQGERSDKYLLVETEHEGKLITGWVLEDAFQEPEEATPPLSRKYHRVRVPKDEGLLLRRDDSFFYGLTLGGNIGIIQTEASDLLYVGGGFLAGGSFGFYVARNMPLRLSVLYEHLNGAGDDGYVLSFGFVETGVTAHYQFLPFEVFAGTDYAFGANIGESIPAGLLIGDSLELSNFGLLFGLGYQAPLSSVIFVCFEARYRLALIRSPINTHAFGLLVSLQFKG